VESKRTVSYPDAAQRVSVAKAIGGTVAGGREIMGQSPSNAAHRRFKGLRISVYLL